MSRIENSQKIHWIEILSVNNSEDQTKYNEALAYVRQNYMEVLIYCVIIFFAMLKYLFIFNLSVKKF